jgi:uncharacterized protein (TIRG00374 family)
MTRPLLNVLRVGIPLLVAGGLLFFAFRNVDFEEFIEKLQIADYRWVIASIVVSIGSYVSRAYRWQLLLEPLGHKVSTYRMTLAVIIGYLANLAFPRLGEVTRCAVLKRTNNIPMAQSMGTVVTERVVDALTLLLSAAIAAIIEFEVFWTYFSGVIEKYNIDFTKIFLFMSLMIFLAGIGLYFIKTGTGRFMIRIKEFVKDLYHGALSIVKMKRPVAFLMSTLIMWLSYLFMSYLIVFSLEETSFLNLSAGFMLLVTGGIALVIPVPGGIGTYHAMISSVLLLYGVAETTGVFLATLLHTSQVFAFLFFGGIALLLILPMKSQKNESIKA